MKTAWPAAVQLAEIGEIDAAQAWIRESERFSPGNLHAASAAVSVAYDRGDNAAAMAGALKLAARWTDERHDFWRNAMTTGCIAARELGRYAEIRTAMEAAGALPRDLSPAGFAAWVGPKASPRVRLRQVMTVRFCAFDETEADAPRRAQLLALMSATFGADWESHDEWRGLGAELRNDREAMIAGVIAPQQTSVAALALRVGSAQLLGIADDARVAAHFAGQRSEIERMRAALPDALAKEGLPMHPGNESKVAKRPAPARQPGNGPE